MSQIHVQLAAPQGSGGWHRVDAKTMSTFVADVFHAAGLPADDAGIVADVLVGADLAGVESHGVMRVPLYLGRVQRGFLNPQPAFRWEQSRPGVAVLDADNAFGHVAAVRAMERAITLAKECGIGCVGVRNSSHFGRAAHHSSLALEEGCIGISMTNGPPVMAPAGGTKARLCNNPLSVAIPVGDGAPVVLDIAMSVAAGGKIHLARQNGDRIPFGWALSSDGQPTDDPEEAVAGSLLPMGGHKGYGLAFVIEALAGVLTGSEFGLNVRPQWTSGPQEGLEAGKSRLGHLCIAIDIAGLAPPRAFATRMAELVAQAHSCPPAQGVDRVLVPGEPEQQTVADRTALGIRVSNSVMKGLIDAAREVGVTASFEVDNVN